MSYRDVLFAGAGASAMFACFLIWASVLGGYSRFSLFRRIRDWARLPPSVTAPLSLCAAMIPAALLWSATGDLGPKADAREDAAYLASEYKDDQEVESLQAYVDQLPQTAHQNQSPIPDARKDLPDVETMISRLATRLENDKSDKVGWRTLGWAYLNTERYADAVKAYEVALALDPSNTEVKTSLDEARVKLTSPAAPEPAVAAPAAEAAAARPAD